MREKEREKSPFDLRSDGYDWIGVLGRGAHNLTGCHCWVDDDDDDLCFGLQL